MQYAQFRLVSCLLVVLSIGCASDKPAIGDFPPSVEKIASDMGLRAFTFPRGIFAPGTFVRLNKEGSVASSPVGSLGTCAPMAKLSPVRGAGLSGAYGSTAKNGLRVDLALFGQASAALRADLGADSYALLKIENSYSLVEYETDIRDAVSAHFGQMGMACREVLREPSVAVLTEVFYAAAGSRMQFFRADGKRIDLGAPSVNAPTRALVSAGNARIDSGDLVFTDDLPLFYSAVKPSPPIASCPFDFKVANEPNYLGCVKALAMPERQALLSDVSHILRREFARETKTKSFRDSPLIINFFLAIDPDNGHGLYYDGTLTRWLNMQNRMSPEFLASHVAFRRYLQVERTLPAGERDGSAEACYARARGYCNERTAWIHHQMANDMYQIALAEARADRKQEDFRLVKYHAEACLDLRPKERCFSGAALLGFTADQLIERANQALRAPGTVPTTAK